MKAVGKNCITVNLWHVSDLHMHHIVRERERQGFNIKCRFIYMHTYNIEKTYTCIYTDMLAYTYTPAYIHMRTDIYTRAVGEIDVFFF